MDITPIIISLKTAITSILVTFFIGTLVAYSVFRMKQSKGKMLFNSLLTLPLVLPPTVFVFFLLSILGVKQPVGKFFLDFFSVTIVFSWEATVIAAVAISFPLMYRSAISAFEQIDADLFSCARTLGFSERKIFFILRYL